MRVPPFLVLCFFPGVFLSSRVLRACPVTEDLIMRVSVRTSTTAVRTRYMRCSVVVVSFFPFSFSFSSHSSDNSGHRYNGSFILTLFFLVFAPPPPTPPAPSRFPTLPRCGGGGDDNRRRLCSSPMVPSRCGSSSCPPCCFSRE